MIYIARAAGVTIRFMEGQDITWFLEQAMSRGAVVSIERLDECDACGI